MKRVISGIRFWDSIRRFSLFAKALDELWSQESVDELLAQADVSGDGQLQFEERGLGWRGMDHWKRMKKVDIYLQKKGHRWWERTCVKVECISIMLRWCLIATHVMWLLWESLTSENSPRGKSPFALVFRDKVNTSHRSQLLGVCVLGFCRWLRRSGSCWWRLYFGHLRM